MLLTDDQLATFRERGYVILKNVLSTDKMTPLLEAIDCLRRESELPDSPSSRSWWENMHAVGTKRGPVDRWECRNIVTKDPRFLALIDLPQVLLPVIQILGVNIALLSSHALIRYRSSLSSQELAATPKAWHRDLGISSKDMGEPLPRLAVKAVFWLTPISSSDDGPMCVIPGSHRLMGRPAVNPDTGHPYGETGLLASPGDVLLFDYRVWHAPSGNQSHNPRTAVFFGLRV
jgi:ectoine hydroxylase